jgi:hypothetical protein
MNRENLEIGKCYWVAAPNLYNHTTYEVDKFELVSVEGSGNRCMCWFTRPKNWKRNKDMSDFRRGWEIKLDSSYVFSSQKEAFADAAEQNWMLSRRAARAAIKYGG